MNNKQVKTALITGANRGIGYAIANAVYHATGKHLANYKNIVAWVARIKKLPDYIDLPQI